MKPKKLYNKWLDWVLGSSKLFYAIKNRKNCYITIIPRPKLSDGYSLNSKNISVPKFAIVVQGKIVEKDSFTKETIKIYKKSFNNSAIIYSSHEGADQPEALKELGSLGVTIVLSPKPTPGPFNINLQITSSVAGLKKAKELGFEYAIKTRSDVRLYAANIEGFLFNLLKQFPIKPGKGQKERIISTNIFTLKYRPYSLSDMTVAGNIDDLLEYFDVPLDKREKIEINSNFTVGDFMRERPGEIYLETEFLKKVGQPPLNTLEDSWRAFAERFCVIDQQALDSYWFKYEMYSCLENKFLRYDKEPGNHDLNFREWFNLYCLYDQNPPS